MTSRREPSGGGSTPFVCFAGQDWWYHNRAHSEFQLMTRIARNRKVLLVNSIGMRMPAPGRSPMFFRRILRKVRSSLKFLRRPVADLPNFHVLSPIIAPAYGTPWLRALNYRLVRAQVSTAMRFLRIRQPHVFATLPTAWDVVRTMPRRSLIYNRSDKHSEFPEVDREYIASLEDLLLAAADRVIYTSRELQNEEALRVGKRSRWLDHGVDTDHFVPDGDHAEPADLRAIPRPRVGFFGGFDDYVIDFELLERVARELPEARLVLIGRTTCSLDRLTKLPNVHWLGFKPYEDVPAYGRGFDVALMPWLDNEWIRHCNPIKLKEYLALGLNIVSTPFPEIDRYRDRLRVADDRNRFPELVQTALRDGALQPPAALHASVESDSWDSRARELIEICDGGREPIATCAAS